VLLIFDTISQILHVRYHHKMMTASLFLAAGNTGGSGMSL